MPVIIARCDCQHPKNSNNTTGARFQDQEYGKGMRVHNVTKGGRRCTVCGTEVVKR